jgi:hypothetical protein
MTAQQWSEISPRNELNDDIVVAIVTLFSAQDLASPFHLGTFFWQRCNAWEIDIETKTISRIQTIYQQRIEYIVDTIHHRLTPNADQSFR